MCVQSLRVPLTWSLDLLAVRLVGHQLSVLLSLWVVIDDIKIPIPYNVFNYY